ncbi:DsrE/DsrF/DrsH-like family protein [Nostocoides jenkinsii]|nr:DsrE/DsrF/DrsH-like family protein [Tetrasphaera jenkinsii]
MTAMATKMMKKQMADLDIPDVPEFLDLLSAAGVHMYACRLSFAMMKMIEADLHPGVQGVISAADFIEISANAQTIFI